MLGTRHLSASSGFVRSRVSGAAQGIFEGPPRSSTGSKESRRVRLCSRARSSKVSFAGGGSCAVAIAQEQDDVMCWCAASCRMQWLDIPWTIRGSLLREPELHFYGPAYSKVAPA